MITFESLRAELDSLEAPSLQGERRTYWATPRKLGVARTFDGGLEILIVGSRLRPRTPVVRRLLEHGPWLVAETGDEIEVNKVVLPSAPHFQSIAALIAIELIRGGIATERPSQEVFSDVEPLIELSLQQGTLADEHVIGLVGELLCLEAMLDAIRDNPELRMSILDMWQGHRLGQRDFTVGATGIEVKTTSTESSSHKIGGLHQVELTERGGKHEERLLLLSIGLATSEHEGRSLPDVVQQILERLRGFEDDRSTLQRRFLSDIAGYGSFAAKGYDHVTMAGWSMYQVRFRSTFTPRLYDILDEDIRIVRSADLTGTFVSSDDIQYRLDLPAVINGRNPVPSWQRTVADLVRGEFKE